MSLDYNNTDALIYVVDSNDRRRVEESALELQKLLRVCLVHLFCISTLISLFLSQAQY
jgi:hypothetical protein